LPAPSPEHRQIGKKCSARHDLPFEIIGEKSGTAVALLQGSPRIPMTTISATSSSAYSALTGSNSAALAAARAAVAAAAASSGSTDSSATSVTLSDAAKAALALKSFDTVIAETRTALDKLIAAQAPAETDVPDLGSLDRRALFAIATNAGSKFTDAEQAAAKAEAKSRQDGALAGSLALARVTGDVEGIYKAAITYLDAASPEEKATPAWTVQKDAVLKAQKALATDLNTMPSVTGDIVADYITRATAGETTTPRDFSAVAGDARAALDKQYADAKAAGKTVVFNAAQKSGQLLDVSTFDSRSLASIALNQGDRFSAGEIATAKAEIHQRSNATVLAGFNAAASGSDASGFAQNIISAYGSMSAEERSAAGWSSQLYAAALANYRSIASIDQMFSGSPSSSSGSAALSMLGTSTPAKKGNGLSLADYL
jgi:hypothetical protein